MKRWISLMLVVFMLGTATGVLASNEVLFAALETQPLSADLETEFSMQLHQPLAFIEELVYEDMDTMPFDWKMFAESICKTTETMKASYIISQDGKKMQMAASTQTTLPLDINNAWKMEFWTKVGMWMVSDFSDTQNPVYQLICKLPFSNSYYVMDYGKLFEEDPYTADLFVEYMEKYSDPQWQKDWNEFLLKQVKTHMTISEKKNNTEYVLKLDDKGLKALLKECAAELQNVIADAFQMSEGTWGDEERYQMEQYLSVMDEFAILGERGMQVTVSLKNKELSVTEASVHIDCNLYDALAAYGVDMEGFHREKWQIDATLSMKNTYTNVNQKTVVELPLLTEENTVSLFEDGYDYEPRFESLYIHTGELSKADGEGGFSLPLADAMEGCKIAKKYYTCENDTVVITPRTGQYDFEKAILQANSDLLELDGTQMFLSSKVVKQEDGSFLIPVEAIEAMTGYHTEMVSQYFEIDGDMKNSLYLLRENPDFMEPEEPEIPYISPMIGIEEEGSPMMKNGELYLPLRKLLEELGVADEEIQALHGVISVKTQTIPEFKELVLAENSNEIFLNGEAYTITQPVVERDGSAYVPAQVLQLLNCEINSVNYYPRENPYYRISCRRKMLDVDDEASYISESRYLTAAEDGMVVKEGDSYYIPLYPLMGELQVNADDIVVDGDTVTIRSEKPITGFETMELNGTMVKKDGKEFSMKTPLIHWKEKKYLPMEFAWNVLGATEISLNVYYNDDGPNYYVYSMEVPNPLYKTEIK